MVHCGGYETSRSAPFAGYNASWAAVRTERRVSDHTLPIAQGDLVDLPRGKKQGKRCSRWTY